MKLEQLLNIIDIVEESKSKKKSKTKNVDKFKKDRPMDQTSHKLKMARGLDRKHLYQVPKYQRLGGDELHFAKKVVAYAKKAPSGIWKLSTAQVDEIVDKYKFIKPDETNRSKHLGSTGIVMWLNPKNSKYYLVKLGKHRSDKG